MFDFDDDMEDEYSTTISFNYQDRSPKTFRNASVTIEDEQSYHEIVQQFVYFLNAIGYTYIGGLAVLDQNGKEMHVTDL